MKTCSSVGALSAFAERSMGLRLRRINQVRTIHGSLAIEGNTLSEDQITASLEGKRVLSPGREVMEAKGAIAAYDLLGKLIPHLEKDLLKAHAVLMKGVLKSAGRYRQQGVGVITGGRVVHMAPPHSRVPALMRDLITWLKNTDSHPLVASAMFHYIEHGNAV
jgi:Fic family protein